MTYDKFIENKPQPEGKFNAIAAGGTHVAVATAVVGIQYNSNLVKGNDIPAHEPTCSTPNGRARSPRPPTPPA